MRRKSRVLRKIIRQYKLVNRARVPFDFLEKISKEQKVSINDLIFVLGVSKDSLYGLKKDRQKIAFLNLDKELAGIKETVHIIKIELKYLPRYGDRFYLRRELKYMCKKWDITINQFLEHTHPNPRHYQFNILVLKYNKKGFWVGEVTRLSNDFVIKIYDRLDRKCRQVAHIMCSHYNCYEHLEDFAGVALEKIIEIGGTVEKNFQFDEKLQLNILGVKGRFAIINYYHRYCKDIHYDRILLDNESSEDRLKFLSDDRYSPERMLDTSFSNDNKLLVSIKEDIHKKIVQEMSANLGMFETDRESALSSMADKLGLSREHLEKALDEIQDIALKIR